MNYCRCIPLWNACSCTGWESYSQAWKQSQVQFLCFQKTLSQCFRWCIIHLFLFTPKAVECKHIENCNFAESHAEKWCLDPKEEEYATLHGAYLDKNNYFYWERNFKSCKLYVSSCTSQGPTELSSTGQAPWGNSGQELLWGAFVWTSLCNNGDKPSSQNYTLTPGKLFHPKTTG